MVVGGSQQVALNPGFVSLGTSQQGVPVILRELVHPDVFDPVSLSFTARDITTELSGRRPISCRYFFNIKFKVDNLMNICLSIPLIYSRQNVL
ncbi:unnamed protein product [Schistosoma curassoni]|uniref:GMC_OxRdtase_N domain-containing protein n=1 Tax=Schistosoma curassoni TaxID=6186 RepID=A0A183KA65_9TREM|nr:unnamed protein product [Schistosoma curassoni]